MSNKPNKGFLRELARPQKIQKTVSKKFQYAKPVTITKPEAIAMATPSRIKNYRTAGTGDVGISDELEEMRKQRKGRK